VSSPAAAMVATSAPVLASLEPDGAEPPCGAGAVLVGASDGDGVVVDGVVVDGGAGDGS
jgi:hypothetical protein